ncbi:MAG: hypothetical protein ACPIOQ_67825, partial [Promethearchaeia archaeon]
RSPPSSRFGKLASSGPHPEDKTRLGSTQQVVRTQHGGRKRLMPCATCEGGYNGDMFLEQVQPF